MLSAAAPEPKQEIVAVATCLVFDDDFVLEPGYRCDVRPGSVNVRDCKLDALCTKSADCTEKPLGVCGGIAISECTYPFELETRGSWFGLVAAS